MSLGLSENEIAEAALYADTALVPAPGSLGVMLGMGLLATRRRR
jgi:hypothetical protein